MYSTRAEMQNVDASQLAAGCRKGWDTCLDRKAFSPEVRVPPGVVSQRDSSSTPKGFRKALLMGMRMARLGSAS